MRFTGSSGVRLIFSDNVKNLMCLCILNILLQEITQKLYFATILESIVRTFVGCVRGRGGYR